MEELKKNISLFVQDEANSILWKLVTGLVLSFVLIFSLVSLTWQLGLLILPQPNGTILYISFLGLLFVSGLVGLAFVFYPRVAEKPVLVPQDEERTLVQIGLAGFSSGFIKGYRNYRKQKGIPGQAYALVEDIPLRSERSFLYSVFLSIPISLAVRSLAPLL